LFIVWHWDHPDLNSNWWRISRDDRRTPSTCCRSWFCMCLFANLMWFRPNVSNHFCFQMVRFVKIADLNRGFVVFFDLSNFACIFFWSESSFLMLSWSDWNFSLEMLVCFLIACWIPERGLWFASMWFPDVSFVAEDSFSMFQMSWHSFPDVIFGVNFFVAELDRVWKSFRFSDVIFWCQCPCFDAVKVNQVAISFFLMWSDFSTDVFLWSRKWWTPMIFFLMLLDLVWCHAWCFKCCLGDLTFLNSPDRSFR